MTMPVAEKLNVDRRSVTIQLVAYEFRRGGGGGRVTRIR